MRPELIRPVSRDDCAAADDMARFGSMTQHAFNFEARAVGEVLGELCASKARRVSSFDTEGAGKFILSWLDRHGPTSGELLTDAAIEHGFRPHDGRAYGPVFAGLSRKGLIRQVGTCLRVKGHAGAGGRVWGRVD